MKIKTINSIDSFLDLLIPHRKIESLEKIDAYCTRIEHIRLVLDEWIQFGLSIEGGAFLDKFLGRNWSRIDETIFELIKPHFLVTKKLNGDMRLMKEYKRGKLNYYDVLALAEYEQ